MNAIREIVIESIERCRKGNDCNECAYDDGDIKKDGCINEMLDDALKLLKEQEAVEPIPPTDDSDLWRCGYCNSQIFRCTHQRFCHECGQEVKWE